MNTQTPRRFLAKLAARRQQRQHPRHGARWLALGLGLTVAAVAPSADAVTETWANAAGGDWNTAANWNPAAVPTIADLALFNIAQTGDVTMSAASTALSVNFDTASTNTTTNNLIIGATAGPTLTLGNAGNISVLATLAGTGKTFTVNAPLVLTPASPTTAGTYTIQNNATNATNALVIGGTITSGTTTGQETLTLSGANTGANLIGGNISNGSAASLVVTKTGAGNWTLSGAANSFTGGLNGNGGLLTLTGSLTGAGNSVNTFGGTITETGSGVIATGAGSLFISGGTINLSGLNTYTGSTTVSNTNGGLLNLDFSGATAPLTAINIINNAANSSALGLADRLIIKGGGAGATNSQRFNGTTFTANSASSIVFNQNGATSLSATLGGLTRGAASTTDITLPTAGSVTSTTLGANTAGFLAISSTGTGTAYATANGGATFLTNNNGTLGAFTGYATGNASYTTNNNVDVTNGDSVNGITANTLRFNGSGIGLTLAGTDTLRNGAILVTPGNTGNTITGGVLRAGSGVEMVIHDYGALTVNSVIADSASGASTLTLTGTGTTTLNAANTYTGNTTLLQGTARVGNAGAFGAGRLALARNTTVDLNGTSLNVPFIANTSSLATGAVIDNVSAGGNVTLTVGGGIGGDNTSSSTTYLAQGSFNGSIRNTTGTVGLTKINSTVNGTAGILATASRLNGTGVFSLTGANTYTGATTVKSGFIQLLPQNTTPIISASSPLVLQGGGLVSINNAGISPAQSFAGTTLNAGSSQVSPFRQTSTTNTLNLGAISRNTGSTLNIYGRPSGTSSNAQLGGADGTATTTTANVGGILGGYATTTGNTFAVGGGTITGLATASYATALTAGANVDVPAAGLTGGPVTVNSLRFLNATTATTTTPSVALTGDLTVSSGGILTVGGAPGTATNTAAANATITGNFNLTSGNGQDLIFHTNNLGGTGVATMTVTANLANNGATSIGLTKAGAGTLTLTPATANTFTGQVTVNAGNLILGNANALNGNDLVFGGSSQIFDVAGLGALLQNGTLTLNGNNATAGSLASSTDSSGTAVVQNASATAATLTLNGGANTSYAGTLVNGTGGGTLALTKSGTGTQTLTNVASAFTGDVNVGGGILAVNAPNNFVNPATSGLGNVQVARNLNVNNGGTLRFDAGDTLGGATSVIAATLAINAGGTVTNNGASYTTLGAVTLNGGTLTGVGGSGNTQFQMYGFGGDVTVGGVSTTASTISGSGTTPGYHLGTSASGRTGTTFTVADVTGSPASDLNVSAVLVDRTGGLGAASLTKAGAGTMTVSGANSYSGTTTINGGALLVNGSHTGAGSYVVSNGTLGGSGTINVGANSVTVNATSMLAPGNSPGILTITGTQTATPTGSGNGSSTLDLLAGSTFSLELGGTTAGNGANNYDQVFLNGTLALGGGNLTVSLVNGFVPAAGNQFTVVLNDGTTDGVFGTFAGLAEGSSLMAANGAQFFNISYVGGDGNDIVLTASAVPEPGTWAMMVGGLGMLLSLQRFRRRTV